ncbi:MAG: DUF484 family protein, partial [Alphaproteobacteria bacterium]|nr:DUF484 family protein [Alphaproteobacteria bacterium]
IFTDCTGLVQSCALLKLELAEAQREAMLALGVRHSGRFQAGEDIELLSFLAQIAAHQLDRYLADLSV